MGNLLSDLKNAGNYTGIEHRICEISTKLTRNPDVNLKGKFFYLTFRNNKITEKEFAKFIYDKIIRYCIPRKKFSEAIKSLEKTGDERFVMDIHDQARNLFIHSVNEKGAQLGEPGELIAFIILEYFFNAPQIACKMFLKTSEKMPVHGSDSVHIRLSGEDNKLELIWGEAKLYQNLSDGLENALDSIFSFVDIDNGRSSRDRDIDIIKDMPDVESEEMQEELCRYFDPYSEESNNWKEVFCCLVGFDYSLYSNIKGNSDKEIEEYFKKEYLKRIATAHRLFEKKIKDKNLTGLEFLLILLPFQSLNNFRKEFFKLLGLREMGE